MHAFSWIIPVIAAWFPYQNVKDLWKVNVPSGTRGLLGWWWVGWVVSEVLDRIVLASYDSTDTVAGFENLMVLEIVAAAISFVTGVLAIRIVKTLTAGGLQRSAAAPVTSPAAPAPL